LAHLKAAFPNICARLAGFPRRTERAAGCSLKGVSDGWDVFLLLHAER